MKRAVDLARGGWGQVQPNPMVGCVLVRNGQIVGEGCHREFGGPHAEIVALEEAGNTAAGATAYVTLEPCRHQGKTPPCSTALIEAGVDRVVFGAKDPGAGFGGGATDLRESEVEVVGPVLTDREVRRENPGFFQTAADRPWVALKLAVSMDGKLASGPGLRTKISGPKANNRVQWLRAGFDAILVGTNTLLVDDPLLTVRGEILPRVPPRRVVLDAAGKVPPSAKVLTEGDAPVHFFTTRSSSDAWRATIEARGASVTEVEQGSKHGVSLSATLGRLRNEEVRTLLCEGGGRLAAQLLSERLVDRLYLIVAPTLLGPTGVPAFDWVMSPPTPSTPRVEGSVDRPLGNWLLIEEPRRLGHDVWMVLEPMGE